MKKKLFLSLALCTLGAVAVQAETAATAIASKKQTLFSSVNHESTPYRIPAVATLNNGTVLAIADQRPCGADVGNGEVDIYAKVGTIAADGSYSWNPSSTDPSVDGGLKIADGTSSNGYGDAAVVVDRESGKVLVICVSGKVVFSSGSSSNHNKMARIVGSADGLTWQSPEDVTTAFFDNLLPSAYTMFMASGRMIQSQHVKVGDYYRIYGALLVREKPDYITKNNNYVVYSDDFGASWSILGGSCCVESGDEAKVEELPNGDIVVSSRTSGGRYYNVFNFTDLNSASGSWGSATKYSFSGSNSTNGELMLYKGLTDANGTAYNVMLQSLPTGSSRSNVAVYYKAFATDKSSWAVSDFTSGWTKGIEVDNGASAYSTMTILPNGEIGFLYEDDYDTNKASGDYSNIVYVPLTVSEITGEAYTAPVVTPVDPTISLAAANSTLTIGETTTLTATTTSDGAKTYTSSNTAVATVDGNVVTAVAAGTATITVTVAKTDKYNAASATCEITVNAAESGGDGGSEEGGSGDGSGDDTEETKSYTPKLLDGQIGTTTFHLVTFSATEAVTIPSGVKAYYVKATDDDGVKLTRLSGTVIPAEMGVILMGTGSGEIELETTSTTVSAPDDNLLVGTKDEVNPVLSSTGYILAVKGSGDLEGKFAFCQLKDNYTVENYANRAYLSLATTATRSITLSFDDEEGGTTAIDEVEDTVDTPAEYYTLQGVKVEVDKLTPGIYIMKHYGKTRKVCL